MPRYQGVKNPKNEGNYESARDSKIDVTVADISDRNRCSLVTRSQDFASVKHSLLTIGAENSFFREQDARGEHVIDYPAPERSILIWPRIGHVLKGFSEIFDVAD